MKKSDILFIVLLSIVVVILASFTVTTIPGKGIFNRIRETSSRYTSNEYECGDCIDNDGGELIDYKINRRWKVTGDPDCASLTDNTEAPCYPKCYSNSDCGTNRYIEEPYRGQDGTLYRDYRTYTCYNPGECIADCDNQINTYLWENCGEFGCCYGQCLNTTSNPCIDTNNESVLQFKSGFEPNTYILGDKIKGIDNSRPSGTNSWDNLSDYLPWVLMGDGYFEGGSMEISTDPFNSANHVLHLHTFQNDGGYARSQWSLEQVHNWYVEGAPNLFEQQFYRFRMLIPDRISTLYSYDEKSRWYMIWESHTWEFENTRHGIYIGKAANSNEWHFLVVQRYPGSTGTILYENEIYQDVVVPMGEWFTFDIFFKYHETNGEFYASIKRDGQPKQTIAAFKGQTKFGTKLHDQMMFKLYHDGDYIDRKSALGLDGIHQYYDDFEIWSDYHGEKR